MPQKRQLLLGLSIVIAVLGFGIAVTSGLKLFKGVTASETIQEKMAAVQTPASMSKNQVIYSRQPLKGENMGELVIPKLNKSLPIFHGTEEDELEKGVGHFSGSVLPGESDNSVLSGHRDTVFRKLGEVGKNDLLIVRTSAGEFTYKVRKVRIVDADDRTVIVPKPKATLTVTTCYPFNFIGDAPQRYILVADMVRSNPN